MNDQSITCPKCGEEIKLNESLAAPLVAAVRSQYEKKLKAQSKEIADREAALETRATELERQKRSIEAQVAEQVQAQLKSERRAIAAIEARKAKELVKDEVDEQARALAQEKERAEALQNKLTTAQAAQSELLKKERELEDAKREVGLKIERGIQEGLDDVRKNATREAEQQVELRLKDRDFKIEQLTKQINELKQKAEQGSQQTQGEVLELVLEHQLRARFPLDSIEAVGKGESGADVVQHVRDEFGQVCGKILWESKRTKNWQEPWLAKLRGDQRAAGADLAVIVSQALPKDVTHFDHVDGIWVSSIACMLPVAVALRQGLIQLAFARKAGEGQETKVQQVYAYLTGPRFRQRVETIVEKFTDMEDDLDKERKVITKQWAKREEQIRMVLDATTGMYGDLQGIAGKSLAEIGTLGPGLLLADHA